jgi:anti-sigma-K factor RskA
VSEQVEQYLRQSPRARTVVAEYRETASFLAHAGTEVPTGLWERIEERLGEQPSSPETGVAVIPLRSRRRASIHRVAVAAAAAVTVIVMGR